MTHSTMTFRRWLVLGVVAVAAPLGDFFLSMGMARVGPVSFHHLSQLIYALKTPQILLGIALLICFFSSYLASLSWADLTFVLPASSIGNVIVALLAHFGKHEHILAWHHSYHRGRRFRCTRPLLYRASPVST